MNGRYAVSICSLLFALVIAAALPRAATGQTDPLPGYLRDRGPGVSTSMWATFVRRHELILYPFFVYSTDHNHEYQPAEFGYGRDQHFTGRFRMTESQLDWAPQFGLMFMLPR